MKTIFVSLNSKYIHTLLAPRYLANNSKVAVEILESNVNVGLENIVGQIKEKNPDIIALSCYIFNIEFIRSLLPKIKKEMPKCIIILGGYEVAFDEQRYYDFCDYIIKGEGDFIFGELLLDIYQGKNSYPKVIEANTIAKLDDIVSPYTKEYCILGKDKILYMETTRGCPFCCSYCMSANTSSVRAFSLTRVFSDLDKIMLYAPKQVKLVDRTFNYNIKRATQIFAYIIDNFGQTNTNFHFEMAPELFDEELFNVLSKAKQGLFQLEIGIQSYNEDTLNAVNRKANTTKVDENIARLCALKNMRIHTDLIAGLPKENYESLIKGFDRLYSLGVTCLQLGFLKILKGSKIYDNAIGYTVSETPPYEIISSSVLNNEEIQKLKVAEEMLELYYNSRRFVTAMEFLRDKIVSPYYFFYDLGNYLSKNYTNKRTMSAYDQSDCLYNFCKDEVFMDKNTQSIMLESLALAINKDFALSGNTRKWKRNLPI